MKVPWKGFWTLLSPIILLATAAQAGQEFHLSYSPNHRYRVVVDQVLDRRVGDHLFFRYPISLVNARHEGRHFEIKDGTGPLIHETDNGTFTPHQDSAIFEWAPDSLKFFMHLELLPGEWHTYFVDVNTGVTTDVTADLEQYLVKKADGKEWDCQQPEVKTEVVKWTEPHLAFLKLTSICGGNREKENPKLFFLNDSVLFDTNQAKVVDHCMDCKDASSLKDFHKYFLSTIPTATPTPEETPTTQ